MATLGSLEYTIYLVPKEKKEVEPMDDNELELDLHAPAQIDEQAVDVVRAAREADSEAINYAKGLQMQAKMLRAQAAALEANAAIILGEVAETGEAAERGSGKGK